MASINLSLKNIVDAENISDDLIYKVFYDVLNQQTVSNYNKHLEKLFLFAVCNKELFTNRRVLKDSAPIQQLHEYIEKWVRGYINDRENSKLLNPLKNYGEVDEALISRVRASTRVDEKIVQLFMEGHFLFMSAENVNGAILEEYLANVLEPHGWFWCAGSIYRAVDFCYFSDNAPILLQVKNKYNTENSSSSAIRLGTTIVKWNRLTRPKSQNGLNTPLPNWEDLQKIVNIPHINYLLTEDSYLDFIEKNSTGMIDYL